VRRYRQNIEIAKFTRSNNIGIVSGLWPGGDFPAGFFVASLFPSTPRRLPIDVRWRHGSREIKNASVAAAAHRDRRSYCPVKSQSRRRTPSRPYGSSVEINPDHITLTLSSSPYLCIEKFT